MPTLIILEKDPLLRKSLRLLLEAYSRSIVEVATRDGASRVMRSLSEPAVLVLYHRLPDADAVPTLIAVANDPNLSSRHRVVVIPSLISPLAQPLPIALANVDVRIVSLPYDLSALQRAVEGATSWGSAPLDAGLEAGDDINYIHGAESGDPRGIDGAQHEPGIGAA
jgi:CheY-like chemotaxis protein